MKRAHAALAGSYLAVWTASAFRPVYPEDWLIENLLVFVFLPLLAATYRRFTFSTLSYALIAAFLTLHAIGAHYTYSETPIGEWMREAWNLRRNHYDRVVHFSFGLLLAIPTREILTRAGGMDAFWSRLSATSLLLAASALFEVVEAILASAVGADLGAAYLGIQGDIWDAQKDMSLAWLGAVLAMAAETTAGYSKTSRAIPK